MLEPLRRGMNTDMDLSAFIYRIAISLPGFLVAIVFHEWAHAMMATKFGDDTAARQGRLSFNPLVHYDPVGTVIFPMIGALLGGVMFGWARPVPVDPRNFKQMKWGVFWVSFAGPLANILASIIAAFGLAFILAKVPKDFTFYGPFLEIFKAALDINIIIAVFNLIPFPPLDGSKMVSTFLDYNAARKYEDLGRYSFVFIFILLFTPVLGYIINPAMWAGRYMANVFFWMLS